MKIGKSEYESLKAWWPKQDPGVIGPNLKLKMINLNPKGGNWDLQKLGKHDLERLRDALPAGRTAHVHSPRLHSIRQKCKKSLAGLRSPHLDPESYPQCFRMRTKLNNARAGIFSGPVGQWLRLNPKAMSVNLRGPFVWDETNGGDLHIMGPWADIMKAIADGGDGLGFASSYTDIYQGDVNFETARKYPHRDEEGTDWESRLRELPLIVSVYSGVGWSKTDDEGAVVLNAPGEIVDLVGSKLTGIAGEVAPESLGNATLDAINEAKGIFEDQVIPIFEKGKEVYDMQQQANLNKTMLTVTVGNVPHGDNYMITGDYLSGGDLIDIVDDLRQDA
ncbi:MAG: hypothetical protein AAFN27_15585 [Pseudomonadota bacterium]